MYLPLVRNAWEVTKRKRPCTNAIQPETLGNGFLFAVFLVQTLTLSQIQVKYFVSLFIWRKYNFLGFKIGIFLSRPKLCRDSGFSSKIGIIPTTKSGWLDTLFRFVYILESSYFSHWITKPCRRGYLYRTLFRRGYLHRTFACSRTFIAAVHSMCTHANN